MTVRMKRRWRKVRYRFEWLGLMLLSTLLPRLPRRAVVPLANLLGSVAFRFDRRGRAVALANISAAFGDSYSPAQRWEIAHASYCNFGRTMLDLFWARSLTPQNFRRYIKVNNAAVLHELKARGEAAVVVCIHHGNFEWASLAAGFEGMQAMIVTENFKNSRVTDFFKQCREVSGHKIISQETSMIRLLKHVRRGGVAGMLTDLNLRPSEAATVIDTFGMKMCVTYLQSVLVQRGRAKLVPAEGLSMPDGTCQVTFHEPLEIPADASLQQIAQRCWDYFEPAIRNNPKHWLWAYRHWRYMPSSSKGRYPFYAAVNPEFDGLVVRTEVKPALSQAA